MTPKTCAYCAHVREHEGGEYSCVYSKGKFKHEVFTRTCSNFISKENYIENCIETVEDAIGLIEEAADMLKPYIKESALFDIYSYLQRTLEELEDYAGGEQI